VLDGEGSGGQVARAVTAETVVYEQCARDTQSPLTAAWNKAYRMFKQSNHSALFLSSDNVLVPSGVIDHLTHALSPDGAHATLLFRVFWGSGWELRY
jgi:hypothetical protein